jgi:hypothetical protein
VRQQPHLVSSLLSPGHAPYTRSGGRQLSDLRIAQPRPRVVPSREGESLCCIALHHGAGAGPSTTVRSSPAPQCRRPSESFLPLATAPSRPAAAVLLLSSAAPGGRTAWWLVTGRRRRRHLPSVPYPTSVPPCVVVVGDLVWRWRVPPPMERTSGQWMGFAIYLCLAVLGSFISCGTGVCVCVWGGWGSEPGNELEQRNES